MITVFFPHFWLPLCIVSHPLPIIGIWFVVAIWIVVVLFNSNDILRKQSALKVQRERKMLVLVGISVGFTLYVESLGLMALSPALTIMLGFVIYENRTSGLYIEKKQVKQLFVPFFAPFVDFMLINSIIFLPKLLSLIHVLS
ncbi:hypothetical protein GLYMA_20G047700v4 [Glycine max]|nr:hypothetical protein GLYMA_20G047700v4 [Glycine max]KAH1034550.1 hypothetical protein GYH30_054811 [Glycine max]